MCSVVNVSDSPPEVSVVSEFELHLSLLQNSISTIYEHYLLLSGMVHYQDMMRTMPPLFVFTNKRETSKTEYSTTSEVHVSDLTLCTYGYMQIVTLAHPKTSYTVVCFFVATVWGIITSVISVHNLLEMNIWVKNDAFF